LEAFDGEKRSCREQLAQHAARRRYLYRLRHGGPAAAAELAVGLARPRGGSKSSPGGSSTTTTSGMDAEAEEGSGGGGGGLLGYVPREGGKRLRADDGAALPPPLPLPQLPLPSGHGGGGGGQPLPKTLSSFQNLPLSWQAAGGGGMDAALAAGTPPGSAWQRADSGKSQVLALPWHLAEGGRGGGAAAASQQLKHAAAAAAAAAHARTDSGKSSTAQLEGMMEAAAAAVAAAAAELGTPRSGTTLTTAAAAADPPAAQWLQSARRQTPPASPQLLSPQPSAGQSQQMAAELGAWVDEQLQARRSSAPRERQLLEMLDARGGGSAAAAVAAQPQPQPHAAKPQRDAQQVWERLWRATAGGGAASAASVPPLPPLTPQQRGERVIYRPVPQRVGVLAPALCSAVAAGQLPLGVAAAQAQPLAALLAQLAAAAGPLQPHELLGLLERVQPPPVLVAVPTAPPRAPLVCAPPPLLAGGR
jgi:hypothetical protein